ncbi:hypothetical protein GQ602_006712 [Ophiocordyceps camponoti-floridani]|uniref:Uncharacterized protein n=1 Tax=Ophiocordyceps camponoti-floridani TaxID=2030778 RepID=A0A8H4VAZ6_9HYPO|nr:hypothetical protein GQ602_006712 [Ophiocordyceps camponoti-floridani]
MAVSDTEDIIYPIQWFDLTHDLPEMLIIFVARFNDVLDPKKLHQCLLSLLEKDSWRMLAGRLRRKEDGGFEIRVTRGQEAVRFVHNAVASDVEQHPAASHVPESSTSGPQIFTSDKATMTSFAGWPSTPKDMEEMVKSARPLLTIHVTTFNNATIMGVTCPHFLMDGAGLGILLHNWSLVLDGREAEVCKLIDDREELFQRASQETPKSSDPASDFELCETPTGLSAVFFRLSNLRDLLVWSWASGRIKSKAFFLRQKQLENLVQATREEQVGAKHRAPFISTGDVVSAWLIRCIAKSQRLPQRITSANIINCRPRLAPLRSSAKGSECIHNMSTFAFSPLTRRQANGSVASIAHTYRRRLQEQSKIQNLGRYWNHSREQWQTAGDVLFMIGWHRSVVLAFDNHSAQDYIGRTNFAAAVAKRQETNERMNEPGFMVSYQLDVQILSVEWPVIHFYGKDHMGNFWARAKLPQRTWDLIERELEAL